MVISWIMTGIHVVPDRQQFVTHALVEAKKERAQAQDKEPRSSDDSFHADPIVQGITKQSVPGHPGAAAATSGG